MYAEVSKLTQDDIELAATIKRKRAEKKWTQAQLAEKANVSLRTISKYESCEGNPEMNSLFPIARALDISIDALCRAETFNDSTNNVRNLLDLAASCTAEEAEMLLAISRAALAVMRGETTQDATHAAKEYAVTK